MADILQWADWAAMQAMIEEGSAMVSGMTAAEAEAALGATANSGLYVYNGATAAGASNIINFPNAATAAEAAADYVAAGGTTSAAGAATAATGAAENTANLALIEGGSAGTSSVAGLLSVPLPTAAAAIAPLAGVAIGAGLYAAAPDFWENVSRTLLPFCYDDGETMPVVVDKYGNTYYPDEAIEAFKRLIAEYSGEGYVPADNPYGVPEFAYIPAYTGRVSRGDAPSIGYNLVSDTIVPSSDGRAVIVEGNVAGVTYLTYTYNEQTVRYAYVSLNRIQWNPALPFVNPFSFNVAQAANLAWVVKYGGYSPQSLPEDVTPWQGQSYPSGATPIQVLTGYDPNTGNPIYTPYYPLTTPIGDPGTSADPETSPDPSVNPNPAPAIEPYISPVPDPARYPENVPVPDPAPLPDPVPQPQPAPDPDTDPSQDPDPEDVPDNPTAPDSPTDGGEGTPPVIPVIPSVPTGASGLLHVYNPTQGQIDAFGAWLWQTWSDASIWETIQKLFNDPMDGVIGLHELYATPSVSGSSTIKCGYLDSQISSALVGSRYTSINCGSVVVEEYYQNYLDYTPYTQCYVYLPFIGIMPVSADDIIGNAVNIVYHVDSYTGCCIAVITVAKNGYSSPVYQFEGNCAVEIPITSGYQSALMAGLLAVAGTAISGNPSVGLTAAHVGRAGLGKNSVQHSGSFGSSFGAMGAKIPYIIVRRPVQKKVTNYSKSYGYPAHKMVYVGNCQGYLRAREVRVTSTTATNIEKDMIVNALKEGVYVK